MDSQSSASVSATESTDCSSHLSFIEFEDLIGGRGKAKVLVFVWNSLLPADRKQVLQCSKDLLEEIEQVLLRVAVVRGVLSRP